MFLLDFTKGGCIVLFKGVTFCWLGLFLGYFVLRGSVEPAEYFVASLYA